MAKLYPITLSAGKKLEIHAVAAVDADRSSLNLQCGPYTSDEPNEGDTVAMHVDIRYAEQTVVKNDFIDGWGEEELKDFSVQPGQQFVLEIKVTPDSYIVLINGNDLGEFKLRSVPVEDVTHLLAFHDVTVTKVSLDGQQLTPLN